MFIPPAKKNNYSVSCALFTITFASNRFVINTKDKPGVLRLESDKEIIPDYHTVTMINVKVRQLYAIITTQTSVKLKTMTFKNIDWAGRSMMSEERRVHNLCINAVKNRTQHSFLLAYVNVLSM